jgi:hypothetical protein
MTIERAFHLIHLLDVPETKRKFWPQWSCVVVNRAGQIEDVIQHFEVPDQFLDRQHMDLYPHSVQFTAKAGEIYLALDELRKKIDDCVHVGSWNRKGNVE